MRFLHVDPTAKTVTPIIADDPHAAGPLAKLNVDHGVVYHWTTKDWGGIGIFVWEHGLLEGEGPYFELMGQLYSGDAVLYRYDIIGETIDMAEHEDALIKPRWLADKEEVELAIAAGVVQRPETRINGVPIWSWS